MEQIDDIDVALTARQPAQGWDPNHMARLAERDPMIVFGQSKYRGEPTLVGAVGDGTHYITNAAGGASGGMSPSKGERPAVESWRSPSALTSPWALPAAIRGKQFLLHSKATIRASDTICGSRIRHMRDAGALPGGILNSRASSIGVM